MVYKIKTYHDEVRRKYGLSTGILGKRAATLSLEERAGGPDSGLFFRGSQMSFSEKLQVRSITFALVSHLSKFIFKLSNSFAVFKRTALVEGRAFGSHAFMLLR